MLISRKTSFAAGAVVALVLGSGSAYAATGGTFLLGKSNAAGASTVLSNKNGTALSLKSKSGTPSLKVNRSVKVANLNADKLDGLSSESFALARGKTGFVYAEGAWVDVDEDGTDDLISAFATCPTGTMLTGGGRSDWTETGFLVDSRPLGQGTWAVSAFADSTDQGSDLEAYAVCYNPKGAVPGASTARTSPAGTSGVVADYLGELERRVADRD